MSTKYWSEEVTAQARLDGHAGCGRCVDWSKPGGRVIVHVQDHRVLGRALVAGLALHSCPYRADVHDDPRPVCACCRDCAKSCADEV